MRAPRLSITLRVCTAKALGGHDDTDGQAFIRDVRRLAEEHRHSAFVQEVTPWGKFTHALNVAAGYAQANGYDCLQFMSLETAVSSYVCFSQSMF